MSIDQSTRLLRSKNLAVLMLHVASAAMAVAGTPADAGRDLFTGKTVLAARLSGQRDPLPGYASLCTNCHLAEPSAAASKGSRAFGPTLDAAHLAKPLSRRGGPPSKYDAVTLCRVLRDGIDPAWIVLPPSMPRYEISNEQCAALWAFLTKAP